MAIAVTCECGRSFKAKDEHAGLRAKCPSCGVVLDIPKEVPDFSSILSDGHEATGSIPRGWSRLSTLTPVRGGLSGVSARRASPASVATEKN